MSARRALNAETDHNMAGDESGNSRSGYGRKTVMSETGKIELAVLLDLTPGCPRSACAHRTGEPCVTPIWVPTESGGSR
jgi:hypothetical protein